MAGDVNSLTGAATGVVGTIINDVIILACRIALLHEFIRDLLEGYGTHLRTSSTNLSGGQKQCLAIVQVWMHDLTVLILGEQFIFLLGLPLTPAH